MNTIINKYVLDVKKPLAEFVSTSGFQITFYIVYLKKARIFPIHILK
jgi:hypothetical protein